MHRPLKRHKALVPLSRDHHFGLLLVWKIRQGLSFKVNLLRIRDYLVYYVDQHIFPHFQLEEAAVFPFLEAKDSLRQQAEAQHEAIRSTFEGIRGGEPEGMSQSLEEFAGSLEAHIRFEERSLFEHMQAVLSPEKLTKLGEKIAESHRLSDEIWEDEFWKKDN